MSTWTPCADIRDCYYKDKIGTHETCRILNSEDGEAPYENGKCPFYKPRNNKTQYREDNK